MGIDRTIYHQIPVRPRDEFVVGLDVGQSIDPSAICVLHHIVKPTDKWTCNDAARTWREQKDEKFLVRHLERLPLGMPYPEQVQHVTNMLGRDPLRGATLCLDFSGCGRPIGDMFAANGLKPIFILITGGNEVTQVGGNQFNVPKQHLISVLEARLDTLKVAAELAELPALLDEMKTFIRKVSASGHVTFNARSGAHDDLVLATAIALFVALNRSETTVRYPFG